MPSTPVRFAQLCLTHLFHIMISEKFKTNFNLRDSKTSDILSWIHKQDDESAVKALMALLLNKNRQRRDPSNFLSLFNDGPPILRELRTKQVKQFFKAAVACVMYGAKDSRILELFEMPFAISSSLVVGNKYIPAKCNRYAVPSSSKSYFATKPPDTFEVIIYIHALKLVVDYLQGEGIRNAGTRWPVRFR